MFEPAVHPNHRRARFLSIAGLLAAIAITGGGIYLVVAKGMWIVLGLGIVAVLSAILRYVSTERWFKKQLEQLPQDE
ncbi:hypothetical protein GCM10017708_24930 [Arthrobacter citreus]